MKKRLIQLAAIIAALAIVLTGAGRIPAPPAANISFAQAASLRAGPAYINVSFDFGGKSYTTYSIGKDNGLFGNALMFTIDPIYINAACSLTDASGRNALSGDPYCESKPNRYDGREEGHVTPVRNQGGTSLCWAFSTISAIETYILKHHGTEESLSQANMAYALSNQISEQGYHRGIADGGSFTMAMAYATRWEGPVSFDEDPFHEHIGSKHRTIQENDKPTTWHVQGFQNIEADFDAIKDGIMKYGSVLSPIYTDEQEGNNRESRYYNPETGAHYNPYALESNHCVQIVGWDNDYEAKNFNTDPGQNGAWIVKNTWGSGFGDNGYLYVSYKDALFGSTAYAVTDIQPVNNYDNIYMYDTFGQVGSMNYGTDTVWFANTFNPESANEKLAAVSFFSPDSDVSYEIYFGEDFSSKTLAAWGQIGNSGYYTVPIYS
ncbi:MAG: lectin like domain-containing protein, partial [Defluviitaleaceae bacterium]|nr:lectin like domain-containing protein [Defluviitaleaceae bacterium]